MNIKCPKCGYLIKEQELEVGGNSFDKITGRCRNCGKVDLTDAEKLVDEKDLTED